MSLIITKFGIVIIGKTFQYKRNNTLWTVLLDKNNIFQVVKGMYYF